MEQWASFSKVRQWPWEKWSETGLDEKEEKGQLNYKKHKRKRKVFPQFSTLIFQIFFLPFTKKISYLPTVPRKVLPNVNPEDTARQWGDVRVDEVILTEIGYLYFAFLLFCFFQPSIFVWNLHMWSFLPFFFPPSKLCSLFLRFYLQKLMGASGSVPSLASGHAGRPCQLPGREARGLDAPSAGTSAASLSGSLHMILYSSVHVWNSLI